MAASLVPLPPVERLSPRCVRVLGCNPGKFTLQGTNTYLVGTGRARLLVDTGEGKAEWAELLAQTLAREGSTLAAVLITHWHPDHVGGIGQARALVPGVPVYQSRLADAGAGAGAGTAAGATAGATADAGIADLVDGQVFSVEGATLRAVHTPGHAADHMVFVLEDEGAVFAGDNVLGQGTSVFEDLATYMASLRRMQGLYDAGADRDRRRLYPGHGPVVDDGPAKIAEYLAHRQQREDQVVRLLRGAPAGVAAAADAAADAADKPATAAWTAAQLVAVIYADVRADLHAPAERGVVQILQKLAGEGKVVRDGTGWRLRARSPL